MDKRTFNALISRGIDSSTAESLINHAHTLSTLKTKTIDELIHLGLTDNQAKCIAKEPRPPIPFKTVTSLLHKCKRTCCICRNLNEPIIIHHIVEWSKSKSHDENNLVVLCLKHHDLAHSKKEISLSLTAEEIKALKQKWEYQVRIQDAKTILGLKDMSEYARWDWVNIQRLSELYLQHDLDLPLDRVIKFLKQHSILDQNSLLTDDSSWKTTKQKFHFLDFGEGRYVAYYLDLLMRTVVSKLPINDITNYTSKEELKSFLKTGSFIALQRGFYFRDSKQTKGIPPLREAYYKCHSFNISFKFDPWYCTSTSALADSMMGHKQKTVIGLITSIIEDKGILHITLSCLAVGSYFQDTRNQNLPVKYIFNDDDDLQLDTDLGLDMSSYLDM